MTQSLIPTASAMPGPLAGSLDRADDAGIAGWAADTADPTCRVRLQIRLDGQLVGTLVAQSYREDLRDAGFGDGRHGFFLHLSEGLSRDRAHEVSICRADDGVTLPGSPMSIPASAEVPPVAPAQAIEEALDAAIATASGAEIDRLIRHLVGRVQRLQAARSDAVPVEAAAPEAAWQLRWTEAPMRRLAEDTRPRALFLDNAIPDPTRDAGSSAVLSHMRAMQSLGYRVDFVAAYSLDHGGARTEALQALGITVWHAPWVGSVEEVLRRLGDGLAVAYLHRFSLMQRYAALVRRWCPAARLVYCVADLHYLRIARQIAVEGGLAAPIDPPGALAAQAEGLRVAELLAALGADAVLTHSSFELRLLRREVPEAASHLVPWEVAPAPVTTPFDARSGVLFVGSYGHAPNLDAAFHLIEEIMPLVWAQDPAIICTLVGSDMPASLRAAAQAAPAGRVVACGSVPDLAVLQEQVRLSVAPLRYGAGLKGKVLDSLAAGLACVCSPMAVEGMDLPRALVPLVGRTAQGLADLIVTLHTDATVNRMLSEAGLAWIAANFSARRVTALLGEAIGAVPASQGRDSGPAW